MVRCIFLTIKQILHAKNSFHSEIWLFAAVLYTYIEQFLRNINIYKLSCWMIEVSLPVTWSEFFLIMNIVTSRYCCNWLLQCTAKSSLHSQYKLLFFSSFMQCWNFGVSHVTEALATGLQILDECKKIRAKSSSS